ncbi:MAG: hypothetical protein HYS27_03210 [Deltaproteobacteria bacterium]|nr:hypothetical protein [Deltaproteobacteria bacterium]
MNEQVKRQLQARVESFAADITAVLQAAVADAVSSALGAKRAKATQPAARPGAGRSTVDAAALLREIARKPGLRVEEIAKNLGVPSKSLKAPVASLVKAKKLKKSGAARGTKYRVA